MKGARILNDDPKPFTRAAGKMRTNKANTYNTTLAHVSNELERLHAVREQIIVDAYKIFESRYVTPAALLLQNVGDQKKAARWMCLHQKAFGGRTAYDLIVEGDDEIVWDEIQRLDRMI